MISTHLHRISLFALTMDSPMHDDGITPATGASPPETFQLRAYQAEMVEESMKANIIVVMDTGSGKTHIAIERTRTELETCQPDKVRIPPASTPTLDHKLMLPTWKLVWFLAPTVSLCEQQYEAFLSSLPGFGHQILCGRDDIAFWTTQSQWDSVLTNVRIVVSTHQVLLEALTHGFVRLNKLALLIFDEAHHCTRNHPANQIMTNFYMPQLIGGNNSLPKVLGLTASPVMKASVTRQGLELIEQNLHATAKTPKVHRSQLMRYVHRPELVQVTYPSIRLGTHHSELLLALQNAYHTYNLQTDPYVIALLDQHSNGYDVSRQLNKLWNSQKTYCYDQLKQLKNKAEAMAEELGTSVMECYLRQCISMFENMATIFDRQLDLSTNERQHLLSIFKGLPLEKHTSVPDGILDNLSQKVNILIDTLVVEADGNPNFTGLVFVEQRVWVASLAEILTCHPRTKHLLRIGTFVGTSHSSKRNSNISTLAEPKNQQTTLDDFRAGIINLVLATSVLEEGIDVSSCHLVICFEQPKNLKSFVQRRGRARQQHSRYLIFVSDTGGVQSSVSWQSLEAEMRIAYEDDDRKVRLAREKEQIDEDGERYFRIESTGALLTLDNASQHLYHFCTRLGSGHYINTTPEFDFTHDHGLITAKVTLPISIDPTVRTAVSLGSWRTERMAQKDAAFEAYKALYMAKLVNDNLLPVQDEEDKAAQYQVREDRPSIIPVFPTMDPWRMIAQYHELNPHIWHRTLLEVKTLGEEPMRMVLLTPTAMPSVPDVLLHWNETKQYAVTSSRLLNTALTDGEIQLLRAITWRILRCVFGVNVKEDVKDFLYLLAPCGTSGCIMSESELRDFQAATEGHQSASELLFRDYLEPASWGLITQQGDMRRFMAKTIVLSKTQGSPDAEETTIQAVRWPKRRDFLHLVGENENQNLAYTRLEGLAATACIVENLPVSYAIFGLLFPSIVYKLEIHLVADTLRTTLLKPVEFDNSHLPIIVTALTSSVMNEDNDYQRLEFLGDCILKFISSLHLMATNLRMPEGILTGKKGKLVSNGYLARAALAAGLDQFILYKRFTGAKWKPRYISEVIAGLTPPMKEQKSSKLIADVIESLIGASYIVGGFSKAFACVRTLLPLENWTPISEANKMLYNASLNQGSITSLDLVEKLLGYSFTNKALLLEALTHITFRGLNTHCSYERLEFLGDAVLDYIVSRRLYKHKPELPHHKMHGIRSAIVNASFLAYSMFETTVTEELTNKETLEPEVRQRALWQFLRTTDPQLVASRIVATQQHIQTRERIATGLESDSRFPWHTLSLTDPPKYLSDIVESVIGALYIDSRGSIAICEHFIERLGIMPCLERILRDNVDCLHPKERLGILAVDKSVKYVRVTNDRESEGAKNIGTQGQGYKVQVKIDGENVGGVVEGLKRLQAETIAAWKAVGVLEKRGTEDADMDEGEEGQEFFDAEDGS
ncbi:dicer 2 [Pyrenophora seminiperda CCB06]|uniref:Dicer 2 n=1 Tax=Pyrenophora seminiperda CCB06 TaxID=1302712 RepID=A0A3M7MIC9_9PLEO|nr:dicer 2 [Pyrenophora seminiperda CCB06]